jgi:hypothetical protein
MNSSYPLLRKRKTYDYDEENKVFNAYNDALNNYNDASGGFNFVFSRQNELDDAKDNLANYGDFSFDINKDAFYKDAVDQYTKLGKLAMEDTIGKASAMTGGYGNSYAQSVGQQAYQGQLDNLNDVGMQLYDRALERYKMGKDDILTQINLLQDESDTEYDRKKSNHDAKVDKLYKEFLIATDNLESYKSELRDEVDFENAEIDALNEMTWDMWLAENSGGASLGDVTALLALLEEYPELYAKYPQLFDKYLKGTTSEPEGDSEPTIEEDLAPNPEKESVDWSGILTPTINSNTNVAIDENSANIKAFKSKIIPESAHDAIARKMYGPYKAYVAVELANDTSLSEEEKMYLITYYGITETDLQYARDKGYDI